MLNSLSEQIRECLEHAQRCADKAAAYPDGSALRNHFVEMEQRWLSLARSIEFGERIDSFTSTPAQREAYGARRSVSPATPKVRVS